MPSAAIQCIADVLQDAKVEGSSADDEVGEELVVVSVIRGDRRDVFVAAGGHGEARKGEREDAERAHRSESPGEVLNVTV